jgi:hypothetical protein
MILEQLQSCLLENASREGIREVILLGGVIISRGQIMGSIEPREDFFQPMLFQSFNGDEDIFGILQVGEDIFGSTFGEVPPALNYTYP